MDKFGGICKVSSGEKGANSNTCSGKKKCYILIQWDSNYCTL